MTPRKFFTILLLLIGLFVAFIITASLAPINYEGSRSESLTDRPIEVWRNLVSVEIIPKRKPDVETVDILFIGDRGEVTWRENLKNGETRTMRILERGAPYYISIEQFQSSYGVTGVWEYSLRQVNDETIVTVTEKSVNNNIWLRGYYTIIGRNTLIKRELKSLRVSLFQRLLTTE